MMKGANQKKYGRYFSDQRNEVELFFDNKAKEKALPGDALMVDSFFYSNGLFKAYKEKGIVEVCVSATAYERFELALKLSGHDYKPKERIIEDDDNPTLKMARLILAMSDYVLAKVIKAEHITELSNDEKSLAMLVWSMLQDTNSNWLMEKRTLTHISEIYQSMVQDYNL